MSGWTAAIVSVLVAFNPPATARALGWPAARRDRSVWVGMAVGAALLLVLAWLSGPILDGLDVSPPTFRLGAAVVFGLAGGRAMVWPAAPLREPPGSAAATAVVVLVTTMLVPQVVFAVTAGAADAGVLPAMVGLGLAVATFSGLAMIDLPPAVASWAHRFVGATAVAVAVAVGIDAARSV